MKKTINDFFATLCTAQKHKKETVTTTFTKERYDICKILQEHNLIKSFAKVLGSYSYTTIPKSKCKFSGVSAKTGNSKFYTTTRIKTNSHFVIYIQLKYSGSLKQPIIEKLKTYSKPSLSKIVTFKEILNKLQIGSKRYSSLSLVNSSNVYGVNRSQDHPCQGQTHRPAHAVSNSSLSFTEPTVDLKKPNEIGVNRKSSLDDLFNLRNYCLIKRKLCTSLIKSKRYRISYSLEFTPKKYKSLFKKTYEFQNFISYFIKSDKSIDPINKTRRLLIVSTNQGIMSGEEAVLRGLGGELWAIIYS